MTQAFGHLDPPHLTPLITGALLANWLKSHKRSTAYAKRLQLQRLLRLLEEIGAPHIKLAKIAKPEARATVATPTELASLFATPAPWLRLFMLLYLQCGLRRAETLRVTLRSWNRDKHQVTVATKGHRTRVAEITEDVEALLAAIDQANTDPDMPCIHALHGKPITAHGINKAWARHRTNSGISGNLIPHDLRRTAANIVYSSTHDLRAPQQLLGHKNLASTLEYLTPLHPDEARKYAELLRFDKFKSPVKQ